MICSVSPRRFIIFAFLTGLLILVGARFVQRCYYGGESFLLADQDQGMVAESSRVENTPFDAEDQTGYDFSTMLKLVHIAQYVRDQTKSSFGAISRREKVNFEEVRTLLNALKYERVSLCDYIWDLKGHSRTGIPPRRYRSLMYYLEVLDGTMSELREILARDPFFHKT